MTEPYTEADVERLAELLPGLIAMQHGCLPEECDLTSDTDADGWHAVARSIVADLAAAGRLLPEGWTVREQFGVCADEREPFTVLPEESRETAEERIAEEQPQWPDVTLRLMSRMVSDWREVGQPLSPEGDHG